MTDYGEFERIAVMLDHTLTPIAQVLSSPHHSIPRSLFSSYLLLTDIQAVDGGTRVYMCLYPASPQRSQTSRAFPFKIGQKRTHLFDVPLVVTQNRVAQSHRT